ncbi:endonuclease/exonuclease/phosphatase family protein [Pseudoalteromonas sp. ZZD1]|uniref:endonuclease/exonuclease/phosphatase family protein n=1 Tax=Pseudoalteromonas sp. ZZD1 TaxID=3139395 RepID=UPI003BACE91D
MKKINILFFASSLGLFGCSAGIPYSSSKLTVATWNLEHLASDGDQGCKVRTESDYKQLSQYVKTIDADVFALQEVASAAAVERIFKPQQWQIIMSSRADSPSYTCRGNGNLSTQQKVAFAVKKSIQVTNSQHLTSLSAVKLGVREGLQLSLKYNNQTVNLLNLHLKSGCFTQDYSQNDSTSCQVFAKQADILKQHVVSQLGSNDKWLMLGDFNHHLADENNKLRNALFDAVTASTNNTLTVLTDGKVSCHPKYPAPIDHIISSSAMTNTLSTPPVMFHKYAQQPNVMLSDHCALSATFNIH